MGPNNSQNYLQKSQRNIISVQKNQRPPNRASFNYVSPIIYCDDSFQFQHSQIIQTKSTIQVSQNQADDIQQEICINLKEIKIKRNSFIKIKQKNYQDEYTIVKNIIGKGGFGVIRKVQSKFNGQFRAAKVIQKKSMKKEDLTKLMEQLHIMKLLDHPNLVKLYEVYDYKNQIVLILQMCSGGQIIKFSRTKKLTQTRIAKIIKQILRVLIYIHSQKIVHRDIKPQNILFQTEDCKSIKIIDFGIAVKMVQNKYLQSRIGTPSFISPQIIYKRYNEKCDIWALGVTMYEMISSKLPFQGENNLQLMRQILKGELQFKGSNWQKISVQCKQVIKLMLKKNLQQRPSAKDLYNNKYFSQISQQEEHEANSNNEKQDVFDNIQNFKFKNKLQAVVQTFIASQLLTNQQKHTLIDIFKQFDSNHDGVLSILQLQQALQSRGNISKQRLNILINAMDTNGSGQIDYTQFLVAGFDFDVAMTKDRLKKVFQYFDTDHNNVITYMQVVQFLQDYESSEDEIKQMFSQVDKNGNGQISQDQFIQLLLKKAQTFKSIQIKQKPAQKHRVQRISSIAGVNQLAQLNKHLITGASYLLK